MTSTPSSPVTVSGSNVGVTVTFHALYTVTFSESGVPSSKTWSVALNGNASGAILGTTTSTTFQVGNGTFSYAWGSTAGYHIQSPGTYTGSVTVHGANPSTVSVTFTHETYTVTFSESGVPSSGTWSVTLNGNASGAILGTTTSTTFSVGNGTFSYTVGTVSGYTPNPSSGSVTVNGANPATVSITFTPVSSTYTVTFTESGMPTGAGGGVNFNSEGLTPFTSGGTVAFSGVASGTYPYTITAGVGYALVTSTPSSPVTVSGSNVGVTVTFANVFSVTFTETNLPTGTSWTVTLNGNPESSTGSSIAFSGIANGTYPFSVHATGYVATPASGSVSVSGGSVSQGVSFQSGTVSAVIYAQTNATSIATYTLPQIQEFTVGSGSGTVSVSFVTLYLSGSGKVSFSVGSVKFGSNELGNTSVTVTHTGWYNISFAAITLALGTDYYLNVYETSGSVGWGYTASPTVKVNTLTEYYYAGTVLESSTTTPNLYSVGGGSQPAQSYTVTFTEANLPTGTSWTVTLNGNPQSSTTTTIVFSGMANGGYGFTVGSVSGYTSSPSSGTVTVSGSNVNQGITFTVVGVTTYTVTFTETNLPTGTSWTVTLNGNPESSTGSSIAFSGIANGTYPFSVHATGYVATPASGSVSVSGGSVSQGVSFQSGTVSAAIYAQTNATSIATYTLPQIQEFTVGSGSGTVSVSFVTLYLSGSGKVSFSVGSVKFGSNELGNTSVTVTHTGWYNISFAAITLALGTDYYLNVYETSGSVGWGYTASPTVKVNTLTEYYYAGTVLESSTTTPNLYSVGGGSQPAQSYTVTFTEANLPTGTSWTVTLNGNPQSSTTTTIVFSGMANGGYGFTVGSVSGYTSSPSSGTVTVSGSNVNQGITFTVVGVTTYTVTFTETNLPTGTSWTVTLNGNPESSTGSSIAFSGIANGTYPFSVHATGYVATPASGSVSVSGGSVSQGVSFQSGTVSAAIYAQTNATSIATYTLPQIQEFTVGSGSGTVSVSFVTLYLSGSGKVSFSVGSVKFGSNELGNTSVTVTHTGWYNISFAAITLALGTDYYLNVYETSGSVGWGYTASPTVKVNTLTEYYYAGTVLESSTTTPNLYSVGYTNPPAVPVFKPFAGRSTMLPLGTMDAKTPRLWTLGTMDAKTPRLWTLGWYVNRDDPNQSIGRS